MTTDIGPKINSLDLKIDISERRRILQVSNNIISAATRMTTILSMSRTSERIIRTSEVSSDYPPSRLQIKTKLLRTFLHNLKNIVYLVR